MTDISGPNPRPASDANIPLADLAGNPDFQITWLRIQKSAEHVGRMIWLITLIAGLISLIVVLSVVLFAIISVVQGRPTDPPEVLVNWGGIILGFYFGQFINLVKDFMGVLGGGQASFAAKAGS